MGDIYVKENEQEIQKRAEAWSSARIPKRRRKLWSITKKLGILSVTQLKSWVKWYNDYKEFKGRREAGTDIYMVKGRKTTQDEREEIVAFCIEHGKAYPLTTQTYGASYQQIYAWVRKYEEKGIDGLRDGRGRIKLANEMSAKERLRIENRI